MKCTSYRGERSLPHVVSIFDSVYSQTMGLLPSILPMSPAILRSRGMIVLHVFTHHSIPIQLQVTTMCPTAVAPPQLSPKSHLLSRVLHRWTHTNVQRQPLSTLPGSQHRSTPVLGPPHHRCYWKTYRTQNTCNGQHLVLCRPLVLVARRTQGGRGWVHHDHNLVSSQPWVALATAWGSVLQYVP